MPENKPIEHIDCSVERVVEKALVSVSPKHGCERGCTLCCSRLAQRTWSKILALYSNVKEVGEVLYLLKLKDVAVLKYLSDNAMHLILTVSKFIINV